MSSQPPNQVQPTNTSTEHHVQRIAIEGMPGRLQILMWLGSTAIGIVLAILGFGSIVLNKSLDATESRLTSTVKETVSPIQEKEAQLRFVLGFLVEKNTAFTDQEKKIFSELLKRINYDDFRNMLERIPDQARREPLDKLIEANKVEEIRRVTGLVWSDGNPAQIRYIRSKDPSLDLNKIDFYTIDDNPCESKNLDILGTPNVSAKVCGSHISSKRTLELIVVEPPPEKPQAF